MSASDGHPLPWSAGRRNGTDTFALSHEGDESREWVAVWDIDDADGNRVATVVEPIGPADREPDRPLPPPRPGGPPMIGNGRGVAESGLRPHWCHDDSDSVVEFIGCVCSTGVDHWSDQVDRPDLNVDGVTIAPKLITGPAVVLDLVAREHERREHERAHPMLRIDLEWPAVVVNVPGMGATTYGQRDPARAAWEDQTSQRQLPHRSSRLHLQIVRAMLADAVAVVDERLTEMATGATHVAPEAVTLAADRIDAALDRARDGSYVEPADVRVVLRDVARRTPTPET